MTLTQDNPPADEAPATTSEGAAISTGGGLRSAVFSFSHVDGLTLRASVADEEVRGQWKLAGEGAAEAARRQAADASAQAQALHAKELNDRQQGLLLRREGLEATCSAPTSRTGFMPVPSPPPARLV